MSESESAEVSSEKVMGNRVKTDCCLQQNHLLSALKSRSFYEFEFALVELQSNLKATGGHLNDLEVFDLILSTPKSGKFIELCLGAGASFYKVSRSANSEKQTVNPHLLSEPHPRSSHWKSPSLRDALTTFRSCCDHPGRKPRTLSSMRF
jgi:hypothetical protein